MSLSRVFPALKRALDNQYQRDEFVIAELSRLPAGASILDAGCGSQRYRSHCAHLKYYAQDFAQYKVDAKPGFAAGDSTYEYGSLDYVGDIWDIPEKAEFFDAILCTEVLEHIPYPIRTVREFARLLRPGGRLILTAPNNCLRHMDPYFFSSGFSDRFYERILPENGLAVTCMEPVGDYYRWLAVEMARTAASHSVLAKVCLAPAFLYYMLKKRTETSVSTLCMGYHVVAHKAQGAP